MHQPVRGLYDRLKHLLQTIINVLKRLVWLSRKHHWGGDLCGSYLQISLYQPSQQLAAASSEDEEAGGRSRPLLKRLVSNFHEDTSETQQHTSVSIIHCYTPHPSPHIISKSYIFI